MDAEQGDTRKAIKASVAKMLGVKADEISLTQIKPETWQRWARVKRLALKRTQNSISRLRNGNKEQRMIKKQPRRKQPNASSPVVHRNCLQHRAKLLASKHPQPKKAPR